MMETSLTIKDVQKVFGEDAFVAGATTRFGNPTEKFSW